MFKTINHRHQVAITLLLLLAVALAACATPTPVAPEPTEAPAAPPTDNGEPLCRPNPTLTELGKEALARSRAASRWINNQIILTGPAGAVEELVANLGEERVFAVELCDLTYLDERQLAYIAESPAPDTPGKTSTAPHFGPEEQAQLVSILYVLAEEDELLEVVRTVNSASADSQVFADLNYLTGPLAISPCGDPTADPFEVGGSPFEVGGSPFEVGGSPAAGPGAGADPAIFWQQWALVKAGARSAAGDDLTEAEGDGVTIAVFDTSPFPRDLQHSRITVGEAPVDMSLTHVFYDVPDPVAPPAGSEGSVADVSDHGLFVSGLTYAVAQRSDIELIRILNDYGCGDLQTLNKAIHSFIDGRAGKDGRLDGTVLNFSLGVHKPDEGEAEQPILPPEIVSLEEAIRRASGLGAVIVAASGNDSADLSAGREASGHRPMQLPADYDVAIGVAASTIDDDSACYSNQGDLSAPGADGQDSGKGGATCVPASHLCGPSEKDCPWGVVSLFTNDEPGRRSDFGFRFWVGTSFAAPLVAGQAALLLERGAPPADVKGLIAATAAPGTALGAGVVDIEESMSAALP